MQDFTRAMKEVRRTLNQIFLFEVLLNGLLVFLIFYLLFLMVNFRPSFALFPALVYFIVAAYLRLNVNKARVVEGKHAALREKLRTAADYMGKENPLVEELEGDVLREMRNVGISQFVNARGLSYRILIITILSFGIIFSSTLDIHFIDLDDLNLFRGGDPNRQPSKGAGDFDAVRLKSDDAIYGNEDVAQLGSEELNIRIKPVDFKVSVKEEGDLDIGTFDNAIFPKDAYLKEGEEAKENIAKEDQEIVKNYFRGLAEQ
jgi:hypothetical protein